MGDKRTDSGQYYPGGNVVPHQPVRPGGGSDANAVHYYAETKTAAEKAQARANIGAMPSDTPIPSVDGKLPMRPLPKYLHHLAFDDTYPEDAAWLYAQLGPSDLGRCSAVRSGGKLWRNYDWTFDNAAEFVVRMSGNASRFASVGVASVGSRLTENDVMSAVNSRYYKCLPGMTLDGINEKGVVCEINVDGGPKTGWHGDADEEGIHILAAVRWALDHGESAEQAAAWIADHIIQPTGDMNFHFIVADADKTYIVENGKATYVDHSALPPVLTNFGCLLDDGDYQPEMSWATNGGAGYERYMLLRGGADISAVNFTNAYKSGNDWDSDFESEAQHAEAIRQWAAQGADKESHRGKTTSSGKAWWQSVHTTEYDFAAKTMKVAVQEVDDWYTFAVDAAAQSIETDDTVTRASANPVKSSGIWSALCGALAALPTGFTSLYDWVVAKLGEKRDKTDLFTLWVPDPFDAADGQPYYDGVYWYWQSKNGDLCEAQVGEDDLEAEFVSLDQTSGISFNATREKIALTSYLASKLDADDPVLTATAPSSSASATALAGAKATGEALEKKADEFTPWERNGVVLVPQPVWMDFGQESQWNWTSPQGDFYIQDISYGGAAEQRRIATSAELFCYEDRFTATRKRVLRTGDAATPQELTAAVAPKADRTAFASEYSTDSAYAIGAFVWHEGNIFQCKTAIAAPGEAWNAAHWNGPQKLSDFFEDSNSLLIDTIEQHAGGGDTTFCLKYDPENDVLYYDDGEPEENA